jgi:hypothetical protein
MTQIYLFSITYAIDQQFYRNAKISLAVVLALVNY